MNRSSKSIHRKVEKIVNDGNWFIVQIIEKLEPAKPDTRNVNRKCTVYGNWHLIKAGSAEKAYAKAEKIGRLNSFYFINADKQNMKWEFVGIGDLLPIYEDIEDKGELMYADFGDIPVKDVRKLIVNKKKHLANIKPLNKGRK